MTKFRATCGRPSCAGGSRRSRCSVATSSVPTAPSRTSSATGGQERVDDRPRLHRHQVVGLLADTEELHRELELVRDRQDSPALRGAMELGDDDAGDLRGLGELPRLHDGVLARRAVEDEEHLVRRARASPAGDLHDLPELVHQVALRVQPPGGVGDDGGVAARGAGLDGVENDGGRIAVGSAAHDRDLDPLRPDLELLDRRRPERVRRREERPLAGVAEPLRELRRRRRLPAPVDADEAEGVAIDDEPECEGIERVDRGDVRYKLGSDRWPWNTVVEYARWRPEEVEARANEMLALLRARNAPFMWAIGPNTDAPGLASILASRGLHKEVDALLLTAKIPIRGRLPEHDLRLVEERDERTATDAIRVDRDIAGEDLRVRVEQRMRYLGCPSRRGGGVVAYRRDLPVGRARWRYCTDGETVYLHNALPLRPHRRTGASAAFP